jgi:hypothetical protein
MGGFKAWAREKRPPRQRVRSSRQTGQVIETPKLRSAVEFKITRRKSAYAYRLIGKVHPKSWSSGCALANGRVAGPVPALFVLGNRGAGVPTREKWHRHPD